MKLKRIWLFGRSRPATLSLLVLAIVCLIFGSCGLGSSDKSVPKSIQSLMKDHRPEPGLTQYLVNGPDGGTILSIVRKPDGAILASTYDRLYQSTDGGNSWHRFSYTVNGETGTHRISKLVAARERLFALVSGNPHSMFVSSDGGSNWSEFDGPNLSSYVEYVDLSSDGVSLILTTSVLLNQVANGDYPLYRSDEGNKWYEVTGELANNYSAFKVMMATLWKNSLLVNTAKGFFISSTNGSKWDQISGPDDKTPLYMANSSGLLLLMTGTREFGTRGTTHPSLYKRSDDNLTWDPLTMPAQEINVSGLTAIDSFILFATDNGIFRLDRTDGSWKSAYKGLDALPTISLESIENDLFLFAGSEENNPAHRKKLIYRSKDSGETWQDASVVLRQLSSEERDQWQPSYSSPEHSLIHIQHSLFVADRNQIYRSSDSGQSWDNVAKLDLRNEFQTGKKLSRVDLVAVNDTSIFAHVQLIPTAGLLSDKNVVSVVFRSDGNGLRWRRVTDGLEGIISAMASDSSSFFVATNKGVFKIGTSEEKWQKIKALYSNDDSGLGPAGTYVLALAPFGSDIIAGTAYRLSPDTTLYTTAGQNEKPWTKLAADGLSGGVRFIWIDEKAPEIIIAGTYRGLFWSIDSGVHFKKSPTQPSDFNMNDVRSIYFWDGRLFACTYAGLFYLHDQIPRGHWYERAYQWIKEHDYLFSASVLAVLVLIVFSTRTILIILKLDIEPIKSIAPAFYLTPLGRWKLYRRYRIELQSNRYDFNTNANAYVDVPYAQDQSDESQLSDPLSERLTQLIKEHRVAVISEGGRGKSTLCHFLAMQIAKGKTRINGKRREPVIINGVTYKGNMLESVTSSLKRYNAYVNSTIVESQLEHGNLCIIFDGYSEVSEAGLKKDQSDDKDTTMAGFAQSKADVPMLVTSRDALPSDILSAFGNAAILRLKDLDKTTEPTFLKQHLKNGEKDVKKLISLINEKFPDLPRIPLMLKIMAKVYDRTGDVPKDTINLFKNYTDDLLRPEVTRIDPEGLRFMLRHLVRKTYLESEGDRGFTMDKGVEVLSEIKDRLKDYNIEDRSIGLLKRVISAGIYKEYGENLKFFHDSFESYFAAHALERDFRNKQYDMIIKCFNNPRLSEVRDFFEKMLADPKDREQLQVIIAQAQAAANARLPKWDLRIKELEQLLPTTPFVTLPRF